MIPPLIRYLIEGGHQAPSADNSQPWRFSWDGEVLELQFNDAGAVQDVFGPDSHCEAFTMGAVVENIVQLAADTSVEGDWDLGHRESAYLRFKPASLPDRGSWPRTHAVFTRHTNRFRFKDPALSFGQIQNLTDMSEGNCVAKVYTDSADIDVIADLVRRASSLRFRNQRLHEWFGKTLRFTRREADRGTGLDVATIDLPPAGTVLLRLIMDWRRMKLLNSLGMYRLLSSIEAQAIQQTPGVLAIVGPRGEGFEAGRLMERVWLHLEKLGIAVQPYYVLTDQLFRLSRGDLPAHLVSEASQLEAASEEFFGPDAFPHMLLRFGKASNKIMRSRRLPVEKIIGDLQ